MTTHYTAEQVREIAAIDGEHHVGVLTNCGVSRDQAHQIIDATVEMLRKGIEMGEANIAANPDSQSAPFIAAAIAASRRELNIRNA